MLRKVDGKVVLVRDWEPHYIGRSLIRPVVLVADEQERLGLRPRDPLSRDMLRLQLALIGGTRWPRLKDEPVPVEVPETIEKMAQWRQEDPAP